MVIWSFMRSCWKMRNWGFLLTSLIFLLTLAGCENNSVGVGSSGLGADAIIVRADSFAYSSDMATYDKVYSRPDSFLLGELETPFGTLRADILTQLSCPVGYELPDNYRVDSIFLYLSYSTWMGDGASPLSIDIFEMDRKTLSKYQTYQTNEEVSTYCSREEDTHLLSEHRVVLAAEKMDSVINSEGKYLPMIRIPMSRTFAERFQQINDFRNQDAFNEQFKGLYITTAFGGATMLNITDIALGVYYSFDYRKAGAEADTTVTFVKGFYANPEVRTINRFESMNPETMIGQLNDTTHYTYIYAPAGVYTRVSLPMQKMATAIQDSLYTAVDGQYSPRPYVNMARLRFDVQNVHKSSTGATAPDYWLQPSKYMLLIRENSLERFFRNREQPSDTCAILGTLTMTTDQQGEQQYYSYDLSKMLTQYLREPNQQEELVRLVLVPVSVSATTLTATTSVKQLQSPSATQLIRPTEAQCEVIYSGF